MDIGDLKARQGVPELTAEVIRISEPRTVNMASGEGKVASATIKDPAGEVTLSLWNEQIDKVSIGDRVKITKGYVSEFRGNLQLSTGKFGTLEVLEKQKGLLSSISEQKLNEATHDELEEAEALAGHDKSEPDHQESVTADNIVEAEELAKEEPGPQQQPSAGSSTSIVDKNNTKNNPNNTNIQNSTSQKHNQIIEEDVIVEEEDVMD